MKKLSTLGFFIFALFTFNSCETEDDVVFVANQGDFSFTNSFSPQYILTPLTSSNLAERFTWNTPNVNVPTNITYQLQKSIIGDFTDAETVGATTSNEIALTIGDMLVFAAQLGLDSDPNSEPSNVGNVAFRLRAVVGDNGLETFSDVESLTLELLESTEVVAVCDLDQLYLVGAGVTDAGWSWDTPVSLPCTGNGVYSGNVNFQSTVDNNNFRFFTVNTDWGSGQNYPFYASANYTIDSNFVNANDGDSNFAFVGTTGLYFLSIDTINKTITLDSPQAGGTCEVDRLYIVGAGVPAAGWSWDTPVQLLCTGNGIYSGNVGFQNTPDNNNFRFFTVNTDWGSGRNYPFYSDAGYTIDTDFANANDGDSNFAFVGTNGTYLLTINTITKVITLE